jgi:hypothetical protein
MRLLIITIFAMGILSTCSKNESKNPEKPALYGKWSMGAGDGDTVEFLNSNGRNILRFYDARFITGVYTEREYRYNNGKLSLQMYPSQPFTPVTSFAWNQGSSTFSVLSNELYPMLSSVVTLVYTKVP